MRLKGIVDRTRLCVAEVVGEGDWEVEPEAAPEEAMSEDHDTARAAGEEGGDVYGTGDDAAWDMEISGVYDKTIVELGDKLKCPPVGILG